MLLLSTHPLMLIEAISISSLLWLEQQWKVDECIARLWDIYYIHTYDIYHIRRYFPHISAIFIIFYLNYFDWVKIKKISNYNLHFFGSSECVIFYKSVLCEFHTMYLDYIPLPHHVFQIYSFFSSYLTQCLVFEKLMKYCLCWSGMCGL